MIEQELAPFNAQIEQVRQKQEALEGELRVVEAELETFSADRQRFDALRDACNALDKLEELKAHKLFWEGIPEVKDAAGHVERVRDRVSRFEGDIREILGKQTFYQKQINQCQNEMNILYEEVRDAYDRDERRKEEFVVEREVSSVPYRKMIMPWTNEAESERRFRRAIIVAMLICFIFGSLMSIIKVPMTDRLVTMADMPERLVELVKKEQVSHKPLQKPLPKKIQKESREETKLAKEETKPLPQNPDKLSPETDQPKATNPGGGESAKKKAEGVGVLAFKDAFKDLMKETPVAKLGAEARLSKESPLVAGNAVAQRSLVSIQARSGSSGGIGYAGVSRNIGSGNVDRLGGIGIGSGFGSGGSGGGSGVGSGTGIGIERVSSTIANLGESSRPLSDGVGLGRTDEEIQIVFDRYKASLYRIYNKELRKDPTLRGKILLRMSIETSGEVSMCQVESTDLASPELVAQIVERIKRFNFGLKEGVPKITILYPIDFLPGDLG
jgi:uncharacterized membrane protein YgcG